MSGLFRSSPRFSRPVRRAPSRSLSFLRVSLFLSILLGVSAIGGAPAQAADPLAALYTRVARDLQAGKPLVVTVHVALCDNRAIACGTAARGDGGKPRRNLYWGGAAGFRAFFDHQRRYKRVFLDHGDGKIILERAVYRLHVRRPSAAWRRRGVTKAFDVYLVGLAYRGLQIGRAMDALISQVSQEGDKSTLRLKEGTRLDIGAASHVIGYAGHNHLMDVTRYSWPPWRRKTPVGYFALACMTAPYLGPHLSGHSARGILLTRTLMYPGAFTVYGLVQGLAAGAGQRGVFRRGADAYARYQKRPPRRIRVAFTHDARASFRRRYGPKCF